MKEKIVRKLIEVIFIARYWLIFLLIVALGYITYYVSKKPEIEIRDIVAVFTGGAVVITIIYHILNYEYAQRKFKFDIKSSRDLLSFNIAIEWQKEFLSKNTFELYKFYIKYKSLLENGLMQDFQNELDKDENEEFYNSLLTVLNFLESVCLGVKQGIMDEDFIKGFFQSVFSVNYSRYKVYIEYRRNLHQNANIWKNFTELNEKWLSCA